MSLLQLERLLRPGSVAVVGGDPAARVVQQLDLFDFPGDVWAVHPTRAALAGRSCVASVEDLPGAPDVAFVAVPNGDAPSIVRSLRDLGCGGVVVYSSGFAESGNGELQIDLIQAAHPMPLLGPNCYGYVNAFDGTAVWPDVHGLSRVSEGVAIITQSGNIGINLTMARRGLDIGLVVTAGNQADLDLTFLIEALAAEPRVTAIGVQFEGAADGVTFGAAALRAAEQGKPLVALKMGASPFGAAISASHTGAMVGEDEAWDALFRRYGVARTRTIPEFLETLKLAPVVRGRPRVLSLSASGGEAAHVADLAHEAGVDLPALEPAHVAAIAETVDDLVSISNPMDYHTFSWGDEDRLRRTFAAAVAGEFDLAILVLDFPVDTVPEAWWVACRAFAAAAGGILGLVVATLPEAMPEPAQARIRDMGLIPMLGIAETIGAIAALGATRPAGSVHRPSRRVGVVRTIDEAASKRVLHDAGIAVPRGVETDAPLEAGVPYPVTVKVLGIDHKAAAGAVAVGVDGDEALREAVAGMPSVGNFLIEETVSDGIAELLVSVRTVEGIGWLLTVGAGGSLVELIDDRAHLLVPAARDEVGEAIASLRAFPTLAGADTEAAVDVLMRLQELVAGDSSIVEAEINPLIVRSSGAVAVDAMVTRRGADAAASAPRPGWQR